MYERDKTKRVEQNKSLMQRLRGIFTASNGRVLKSNEAQKGRNRNQACPCGSGAKTKKCCGAV